jgi:TetR/AcrR family transcriptional regulator, transcriptional repressor for nem operon
MPYSKEHKQQVRKQILKSTIVNIKKYGIQKTSVPTIMKGAGLTHGGFYAHFPNKETLIQEACYFATEEMIHRLQTLCQASKEASNITVIIDHYLSTKHRDNPGAGCVLPAISAEMATLSPLLKNVFTECLNRYIAFISEIGNIPKDTSYAIVSLLVGTLTLSRAVQDENMSRQFLLAGRKQAKKLAGIT